MSLAPTGRPAVEAVPHPAAADRRAVLPRGPRRHPLVRHDRQVRIGWGRTVLASRGRRAVVPPDAPACRSSSIAPSSSAPAAADGRRRHRPRHAAGQGPCPAHRVRARGSSAELARHRPQRLRPAQRRARPRPRPGGVPARARESCVVLTGVLHDPYSGRTIPFTRGAGHQRRRADRPRRGAVERVADRRAAARPGHPRAVRQRPAQPDGHRGAVNQAKGDGDAATWLPPARGFRCAYVARQVAVKAKYTLWVTAAERDAIARVLSDCPGEPLPPDSGVGPRVASPPWTRGSSCSSSTART